MSQDKSNKAKKTQGAFKMKSNYVLGLTVILVLATSLSVFAQTDNAAPGGRTGRPGNTQMRAAAGLLALTSLPQAMLLTGPNSTLNLTDDQKTAVTNLQTEYRKVLATVPEATTTATGEKKEPVSPQAAMEKATKDLSTALTTRNIDADTLKAKIKACKEAEDAIVAVNITYWAKLRDILTDDQLQQLFVAMTTRPARGAFGGGQGGQGGQGGGGQRNNNNDTQGQQQ